MSIENIQISKSSFILLKNQQKNGKKSEKNYFHSKLRKIET